MTYEDRFIEAWREVMPPADDPPIGVFPDNLNMMAIGLLSHHNLGNGRWAEVSYGRDFNDDFCLGVSIAREGYGTWHTRSEGVEVFWNHDLAARYIVINTRED